ncbi:hypothetical protein [Solitalea canadensis]|uniref:Phosphatidate cytidylyltransferase n=1 Tax=Solitalea canadensis (strain ATCC 29591 / DSM 3403 / JCM 21819 / LMG 8368 / NBRC 15130 / NCIMB 12057 / USAM 9D) TaxID=929556 RepID=H8KQM4_SOLCM|nr:hypothetical protein [Solitalea canadensis]AFD06762.1 hypothetical protein Solca_1696 [Solitalea canadensis DSM 3403]
MKRHNLLSLTFLFSLVISLSSCSVIEGIFKAGVWSGVLLVVVVIAVIIFIIMKVMGK